VLIINRTYHIKGNVFNIVKDGRPLSKKKKNKNHCPKIILKM